MVSLVKKNIEKYPHVVILVTFKQEDSILSIKKIIKKDFVHTLNGSGLAVGRTLAAYS